MAPEAMAPFWAMSMATISSIKPMFVGFFTFSGTIFAVTTYRDMAIITGLNVS
jgi:hypothetical protein